MTNDYPRLALIYWFGTNLDASIHREWELSLGRRQAPGRMAHLFCELYERLGIVGLTDGLSSDMPLNQNELGECLGLTAVHVNRTLRQLRDRGLADHRDQKVVIHDPARAAGAGRVRPALPVFGPPPAVT